MIKTETIAARKINDGTGILAGEKISMPIKVHTGIITGQSPLSIALKNTSEKKSWLFEVTRKRL
ncbi:MAG: hypothetical protein ACFE9L_21255 [Candidatus Hodarchaeota archaeon]